MLGIPKEFQLFGQTIVVRYEEDLVQRTGNIGEVHYRFNEIILQGEQPSTVPFSKRIETFFHELIHWILYVMEENELQKNEKFISIFAELLSQALNSAVYDYDPEVGRLIEVKNIHDHRK